LAALRFRQKHHGGRLALRVPLALNNDPPVRNDCESGELIKIVAATEVRARQTEARFNNWSM
jgi:hypothetical protein